MNPHIYLFTSILLVTLSQFAFKKGVSLPEEGSESKGMVAKIIQMLFQKHILAGLFLNGVAAVFWLLALSDLELSYVFPFLSLNYILVPLGAWIFYQEKLSFHRKAGIGIICLGIFLIAFS
ncbi:MAG: EamA family transporter [Bacteroidia bacterium]|nr:EamA family transporter [Bacteroidia bacterium]